MAIMTIDRGHLRAASGWAALLGVLFGVPAVLVLTVGSPLPSALPDLAESWLALRQNNISGTAVADVLASGAWLVWAQLAWALLWDAAVNSRRLAANLDVRPAPFVASGIRNLAVRMASGTVVIAMATTATPVSALVAPVPVTIDIDTVQANRVQPGTTRTGVADSGSLQTVAPMWLVQPEDSGWSIASMALGDGTRFSEIAALNDDINSPRDVVAGACLILPAGAEVPTDRSPGDGETLAPLLQAVDVDVPAAGEPEGYLPAADVEIVQGDHLWGISESRLHEVGESPSDLDVLLYVNDVIASNADIVENPDLIYPGEVFRFPQLGVAPDPAPPVAVVPEPPIDPEPVAVPPTPAATVSPAQPTPSVELDQRPVETGSGAGWMTIAGVVASLVAATGLIAIAREFRRKRELRGTSLAVPMGPVERALTEAANLPLLRWAGQEIAVLFESFDSSTLTSAPIALDVYAEGIELLWETTQAGAPHPWEATDGGVAWRLLYDADAPIPTDDLPSVVPGLVTLGTRPGGVTTMVDLEAVGSLSVSGEASAAANAVRSIVTEFGASNDLANAQVVLVGFELDGDHHFGSVSTKNETEALALLNETVEQYNEMIQSEGVSDSFELRVKTGGGPEVTVVVISAEHCSNLADLIAAAEPRRGVVVIVNGAVDSARSHLTLTSDGKARLEPLGLDLAAAAIPAAAAAEVADLLDQLNEDVDLPVVEDEQDAADPGPRGEPVKESDLVDSLEKLIAEESEAEAADKGAGDDEDWEPPSSSVVVRLLGDPHVPGHEDLKAREISLLGLLVCKGGSASVDCVMDHLWADQADARQRKTLHNLESEVRAKVGSEVMPRSPSSYPLTTTATSDYAIFEALIERADEVSSAKAIDLLTESLSLVTGPPFDHGAFEWARSIGVYDRVRQQIEQAATQLVDLALDADEIDVARTGIQQALLGLGLNEPLYRAWMRVEAQAGNSLAVQNVFDELKRRLQQVFGDAGVSRQTSSLLDQLLSDMSTDRIERSAKSIPG